MKTNLETINEVPLTFRSRKCTECEYFYSDVNKCGYGKRATNVPFNKRLGHYTKTDCPLDKE